MKQKIVIQKIDSKNTFSFRGGSTSSNSLKFLQHHVLQSSDLTYTLYDCRGQSSKQFENASRSHNGIVRGFIKTFVQWVATNR